MNPRNALVLTFGLILGQIGSFAQTSADSPVAADAEIRKILADRIGAENLGVGMVVGVIEPKGRRVVAYGSLAKDDKHPLNGDTVFEIGSMTKVFTSLVLMDTAQKGEVPLTDPVSKYLPASVKVPERNNKKITLQDLALAAGLSRMYFAAQFRAATGLRPHEYLLKRRIERAVELLKRAEISLVDVALTVGFQTQAHFTTVFKRFAGDTPYQWRSAYLGQSDQLRSPVNCPE